MSEDNSHDHVLTAGVREQRREPRREATGAVRIHFITPERFEVEGRLMDVSPHGFRMAHACVSLESGQLVHFTHVEAEGQAKVMWNRVLSDGVETGFFILDD